MAPLGVVVRGFDIQAHIPSVASPADGGEQDSGARRDDYLTRARIEAFDWTEQSRSRLVSSCTRTVPIFGKVTDRG